MKWFTYIGLIGLIIVLYIFNPYILKEEKIAKYIQEQADGKVVILDKYPIHQTTSYVYVFETNNQIGYAIVAKNKALDRYRVDYIHENHQSIHKQLINTNRGNYILVSGRTIQNVKMNDNTLYLLSTISSNYSLSISDETIKRKYTVDDIHTVE